jgi:tricarballylate dehydrogenase
MDQVDVLVVGAGNAALAAAVAAKQAGAGRVLVLEKAPLTLRGGNTYWSGALMRTAFERSVDLQEIVPDAETRFPNFFADVPAYTQADFYADMVKASSGQVDTALASILVANSFETIRWMSQDCGIPFEPALELVGVRKNGKVSWPKGAILRVNHEGPGLSDGWFKCAERLGVEIRYEQAVIDLIQDGNGGVGGVFVRNDTGRQEIQASAVILASGGFEANVQWRAQYLGAPWDQAKVRGTPHNQGDGLRLALAVGAMPWGNWTGCHATPISADWGYFAPRELTDKSNRLSYPYGVMINRGGLRFVDEGEDFQFHTYAKFGRHILQQPGALAYQIFDQKTLGLLEPRYQTSTPKTAGTLRELIAQLDLDNKAQALATLEAYNKADRESEIFDPTRKDGMSTKGLHPNKTNWAVRLDTPPFVAYSATGGITFTFGGLKIDGSARVLGTDWRPIKGLYACGEMVGGFFYGNYLGGSGLTAGALFGRIAGAHAGSAPINLATNSEFSVPKSESSTLEWVP